MMGGCIKDTMANGAVKSFKERFKAIDKKKKAKKPRK